MAHLKLEFVNGKDNIRGLPKAATSGIWTAGDILTLDATGKVDPRTAAATSVANLEDAFLGVALSTEVTDANAETNNVHVPVSVFTTEQIWSIKVADLKTTADYEIGIAYKIGYYADSTTYDIGYASGETAKTITVDECYYLTTTAATDLSGAVVVAHPNRGIGDDLDYGCRVHIRFTPHACMQITG